MSVARVPVVVAALAFVVALVALVAVYDGDSDHARWMAEARRAAAFLAAMPRTEPRTCRTPYPLLAQDDDACTAEGFGDADGDGVADCWRATFRFSVGYGVDIAVWPGCSDVVIGWRVRDDTTLLIDPALSQRPGPQWLAERLVGPDVTCTDAIAIVTGCAAPDPAWQWWLDTTRIDTRSGDRAAEQEFRTYGRRAPVWQGGPLPVARPRALVLPPDVHDDVLRLPFPGVEEPWPRHAARIVVENVAPASDARVRCAGLDVRALGTGLVGVDPKTARWTWLIVQPTYHAMSLDRLACVDDLVFGYGRTTEDATVVIVEPRSGGWEMLDTAGDSGAPRLRVVDWGDGERSFRREPLRALARRLAGFPSPDVSAPASDDISIYVRMKLTHRTSCAGWRLAWSRTQVLAERGDDRYWLDAASEQDDHRVVDVRCNATLAIVARTMGFDALDPTPATLDHVVVDLVTGRSAR